MISSLGSHALKALTPQTSVKVDRSRCVRHRCKRNECRRCLDICPAGATSWGERGLQVDAVLCTQCLRCLSVCPTAALQSPEMFLSRVLSSLAVQPAPVLGCHQQPGSEAHGRFPCLGPLADTELLLLLALIFTEGLQVNLTGCHNCANGHIRDEIRLSHTRLYAMLPDHRVKLVFRREELACQPVALSRRELFCFFRERSSQTARIMVERLQTSSRMQAYSSKQVPLVRTLLLKVMETLPELQQQRVAQKVFGQIVFTEACTACGGCVGVCPTGAIDPTEKDGQPPWFNRHLCVGCGSCQAFCRKQGVQLKVTGKNQATTSLTSA